MAVSRKVEREILRNRYLESVISYFSVDEEVLRVKSNEIAIPVVGCEGNEDFIVITVKVPTGANKGLEPYDGYSEAEDYQLKLKNKKIKAEANAEKKKKKIARDAEIRKKKKEIAEKGKQKYKGRDFVSSLFCLDVKRLRRRRFRRQVLIDFFLLIPYTIYSQKMLMKERKNLKCM